jgi:hypothetical protein
MMDTGQIATIALFAGLGLFATCVCMVIVSRLAQRVARLEERLDVLECDRNVERLRSLAPANVIRIRRPDAQWASEGRKK